MRRIVLLVVSGLIGIAVLFVGAVVVLAYGRPPQPLPLGTVQWLGEAGVTVDGVSRVSRISAGGRTAVAHGVFYIVHARILAPFGLRPHWSDRDVEVRTFSGSGGSMPEMRFTVDEPVQAVLDARTGRPGPNHVVIGAVQHEDLVFDLPRNVEQPGILFSPANDPMGLIDLVVGHIWQPHRFNIRYD